MRYIDDCFLFWPDNFPDPRLLLDILNNIHPSLKFTFNSSSTQLPFLDVMIIIRNNRIITDIYRKPTDSMNFVHFHSCHPRHVKRNIPFTVCRRVCAIATDPLIQKKRLKELECAFTRLKCPRRLITEAINRARALDINELRKERARTKTAVIPFITTYNPNNPDIYHSVRIIFDSLCSDITVSKAFSNTKLLKSLRQGKSLKRLLTRADDKNRKGVVSKCGDKRCACCSHIIECTDISLCRDSPKLTISHTLDCNSKSVIYALICASCRKYYIGQTRDTLRNRIRVHRQHINHPESAPLPASKHIATCSAALHIKFLVVPLCGVSSNADILLLEQNFIDKLKPKLNN